MSNNVQDAVTAIREAIQKRIENLNRQVALLEVLESYTLQSECRGGISELEMLLEHLPEEENDSRKI